MKTIPQSIIKELKILKSMDLAPFIFYNNKVEFCKKLYSDDYKNLSGCDIVNISDKYPELINYKYLNEEKYDFIQEQYTFAMESI